jgi:hypothetical protein
MSVYNFIFYMLSDLFTFERLIYLRIPLLELFFSFSVGTLVNSSEENWKEKHYEKN